MVSQVYRYQRLNVPREKRFAQPTETAASASELTPLESHALAKATTAKKLSDVRDRLSVADAQAVDFTVRVRGVVSVAADTASTARETPPADKMLAAVLDFVSPRARKVLLNEVQKKFQEFAAGGELPAVSDAAVDLADDLLTAASREVNKPKRGNVSAALEVTLKKRG